MTPPCGGRGRRGGGAGGGRTRHERVRYPARGGKSMKQLIYVMQFSGQAAPVAGASNVLKARTSAASCTIGTRVGADGVDSAVQPLPGGTASFESEVTVTGANSFVESGRIRFGDGQH